MKTKFKKLLLTASVASITAVVPLASAACASKGAERFDQEKDGKININAGFSSTNRQGRALKTLIDYYNNKVITDPNSKYYQALPAQWERTSGYTTSHITQQLKVKDKSGAIGNIIFNYPAAASIIASYKMSLDFKGVDGLDQIADQFMEINKHIAGVSEDQIVLIPTSKSTSLLTINLPLLGHVLTNLKEKGLSVDETDKSPVIKSALDKWQNVSVGDRERILANWPTDTFDESEWNKKSSLRDNFVVKDAIFDNWEDFSKFVNIVRSYYAVPKKDDNRGVAFVASTDAFPNDFYTKVAQDGNNLFPQKNSSDTALYGGFDFKSYVTKGTPEYNALKTAFDQFAPMILSHALSIGGDGSYGSTRFSKHEYLFTIGSSAGVSYNFLSSSGESVIYSAIKLNNKETKTDLILTTEDEIKNSNIYVVKGVDADGTITFLDGSNQNRIYPSSVELIPYYEVDETDKDGNIVMDEYTGAPKKIAGPKYSSSKDPRYNSKLSDTAQEEIVKTFASNKNFMILLTNPNSGVASVENGIVKIKGQRLSANSKYVGKIKFRQEEEEKDLYIISNQDSVVTFANNSSLVNRDEVKNLMAPSKANKDSEINYFVGQGPSIIGIHANEEEDENTKKFMEWFLTGNIPSLKVAINGNSANDKTYTNKKPFEIFNEHGNYLSTSKDFFEQPSGVFARKGTVESLVFDTFKNIITPETAKTNKLVEDAGTAYADTVRKKMTSIAKLLVNLVSNNDPSLLKDPNKVAFERFVKGIKLS